MFCPICSNENEMAYSVLAHSYICLAAECGFEVEIDPSEIEVSAISAKELISV